MTQEEHRASADGFHVGLLREMGRAKTVEGSLAVVRATQRHLADSGEVLAAELSEGRVEILA